MKQKTLWRWWAKALGEKASKCDKESDTIALIRTFIFATYLITNSFIVAGVIRHWNDTHQDSTLDVPVRKLAQHPLQTPWDGAMIPVSKENHSNDFSSESSCSF